MNAVAHRAERSLLAGTVAGIVAMIFSNNHDHAHLIAQAASQHETVTKLLFHTCLVVGALVAAAIFVVWSVASRSRDSSQGRAPQRRMRREDW